MKIFKKILLGLLGFTLFLVVALTSFVMWTLEHPTQSYQFVEKHFLPADLKITWEDFAWHFKSLGALNFSADVQIKNFYLVKTGTGLGVPVEQIHVRADIYPLRSQGRIIFQYVQLSAPRTIEVKEVADTTPEATASEKAAEENTFELIQDYLGYIQKFEKKLKLEHADIDLQKVEMAALNGSRQIVTLRGRLPDPQAPDGGMSLHLTFTQNALKSSGGETSAPFQLGADILLTPTRMNSAQPFLSGKLSFHRMSENAPTASGVKVKSEQSTEQVIVATYKDDEATLHSGGLISLQNQNGQSQNQKLSLQPDLNFVTNPREARLRLQVGVEGLPIPMIKLKPVSFELTTPLEKHLFWSQAPSKFSLLVPLVLPEVSHTLRRQLEASCACEVPKTLEVKLAGQVWLSTLMAYLNEPAAHLVPTGTPSTTAKKQDLLDSHLSVESVHNKLFNVDLAANLKVSKEGKNLVYEPFVDCAASTSSFEVLKPLLDANKVLFPAPLDILRGALNFQAKGPVQKANEIWSFPAQLTADLYSKKQKVKFKAEALVKVPPTFQSAEINLQTKIEDLQLELPPLEPLGGLPRIAPDSRILSRKPKAKSAKPDFQLSFNFDVETVHPGAIRLLYKYFDPLLPITLNLHNAPNTGTKNLGDAFIRTEKFSVVYLRRRVEVEKMLLSLAQMDKGVLPVDGRLKIKRTQYTIYIDVAGDIKSPNIVMSSDPDLPQNEIMSVLLYDRTSDQLASSDAETSGSMQAAVSDRAIGLFGLWAFASTPIQSFSYNPVTKVYAATVQVSEGVTAGVGTDWESAAHFELRKRLSKSWMLTATWSPPTHDEDQSSKLVLQWENRF